MNIGEKIRNAREDMDMSQREISELIPMNQSNYSKIERNIQEPSMDQLRRICQILKISPLYLLDLGEYENIFQKETNMLGDIKAFIEKYR